VSRPFATTVPRVYVLPPSGSVYEVTGTCAAHVVDDRPERILPFFEDPAVHTRTLRSCTLRPGEECEHGYFATEFRDHPRLLQRRHEIAQLLATPAVELADRIRHAPVSEVRDILDTTELDQLLEAANQPLPK